MTRFAWVALLALSSAHATDVASIASRGCAAIASRVGAVAGTSPVFLRSYDAASGSGDAEKPALKTASFVYDDSLAVIALLSCSHRVEANRVGAALLAAIDSDTRLRNVYRAGDVNDKVLPNGWWDDKSSSWVEDTYQQSTATGNVAWAALAMLALYDATQDAKWRDAAVKLGHWVLDNTSDARGAGGFSGGVSGFDAAPSKVLWKSTEHNIDLIAVFERLARSNRTGPWIAAEASARHFVESQWDASSGHLFIGTTSDGVTPNRDSSGLDAQLWAQLIPSPKADWHRALNYIEHEHTVPGGFDFNADRDGAWIEGTAQAALVYRSMGRAKDAATLFATIDAQFSTGGMVYATREPKITTGLSTTAAGDSADFFYYRVPHLGATAWAVLAAKKWNPFASAPK